MNQQNLIEALEVEREALITTNKSIKKSMWDWKQQLYADASSTDTAIVPLSRLKAIYGEVVSVPSGIFSLLHFYLVGFLCFSIFILGLFLELVFFFVGFKWACYSFEEFE